MEEMVPGQRWISDSEPELGLGILKEVSRRQVVVLFVASEVERRYTRSSAPLTRVQFRVGDAIQDREGHTITVEAVEEDEGMLIYVGGGRAIPELELSDFMSFDSPEERMRLGQWDVPGAFSLRQRVLSLQTRWFRSEARGFLGGRMDLLPHQLSIAATVANRQHPRILLADEPGLGKTIEAGLLLHHFVVTGKAQRVLILLPEPLVHQWFVELLRRFQLVFQIVDQPYCDAFGESQPGENVFFETQRCICSLPWLVSQPSLMAQACQGEWDLILVDEAHHIETDTPTYELVKALSARSWGCFLLTATPEQLGARDHFARLRLLDAERYTDYASFSKQNEQAHQLVALVDWLFAEDELADLDLLDAHLDGLDLEELKGQMLTAREDPEVREEVLEELLDRYGPGRVMFRNTRAQMEGFPTRSAYLVPLEWKGKKEQRLLQVRSVQAKDPRLVWLLSFLQERLVDGAKVLLMGGPQSAVVSLEEHIRDQMSIDTALFHEGMTLIQRDRQAAWFADPEGAQLMLCSRLGGEGRNFQSASHLVLFALPTHPETLEQYIGRLDRIGQGDEIHIHLPYIKGTTQEVWARWFHEGLDALRSPFSGGYQAREAFEEPLDDYVAPAWLEAEQLEELEALIDETRSFGQMLTERLQKGRNRLLEWSSFSHERANSLLGAIESAHDPETLMTIYDLFDHYGVDVERHTDLTWKLIPSPRLDEQFPWLKGDDMMVSFSRDVALHQPTTVLLSLDHPMVFGACELIMSDTYGTCCVGRVADAPGPVMVLEIVFVIECVAPRILNVERFCPPTPLRLAFDHHGKPVSEEELEDILSFEIEPVRPAEWLSHKALFDELVPSLVKESHSLAAPQLAAVIKQAQRRATFQLGGELERLQHLQEVNPAVKQQEVIWAQEELTEVLDVIQQARLRLDSIRLLVGGMD